MLTSVSNSSSSKSSKSNSKSSHEIVIAVLVVLAVVVVVIIVVATAKYKALYKRQELLLVWIQTHSKKEGEECSLLLCHMVSLS